MQSTNTGGIYLRAARVAPALKLVHVSSGDTLHHAEEIPPACSAAVRDEFWLRGPCQGQRALTCPTVDGGAVFSAALPLNGLLFFKVLGKCFLHLVLPRLPLG